MAGTTDRLQKLEVVEREISNALQSAGQALAELGRDKPANKQLEAHTMLFLKTLENVEKNMSDNIMYLTQVSTSQPHEGSSYAAQKNLQMAQHRLEHIRSCVNGLDQIRGDHLRSRQQQAMQRAAMAQSQGDGATLQRSLSAGEGMPLMQQQHQQQLQQQQQQQLQQQQQQQQQRFTAPDGVMGAQRGYPQDPH